MIDRLKDFIDYFKLPLFIAFSILSFFYVLLFGFPSCSSRPSFNTNSNKCTIIEVADNGKYKETVVTCAKPFRLLDVYEHTKIEVAKVLGQPDKNQPKLKNTLRYQGGGISVQYEDGKAYLITIAPYKVKGTPEEVLKFLSLNSSDLGPVSQREQGLIWLQSPKFAIVSAASHKDGFVFNISLIGKSDDLD